MPFKIDFCRYFDGFQEGKWKQVGTQIGAKIDVSVKVEKSIKRQPACATWDSQGASWEPKPIKIVFKFEHQDGVPVGIDFSSVLGGKLGTVIDPKSVRKSISKELKI